MEDNAIKYAVIRADQNNHNKSFTVWHTTFDAAKAEAERLAGQTNSPFYVIQTVGYAMPAARPVQWSECK